MRRRKAGRLLAKLLRKVAVRLEDMAWKLERPHCEHILRRYFEAADR